MYEVTFNVLNNDPILEKVSHSSLRYEKEACQRTAAEIASGHHPQTGYFKTKKEAIKAIQTWYNMKRKELLADVRYCRKILKKYSSV
jgi:hypothetical protein